MHEHEPNHASAPQNPGLLRWLVVRLIGAAMIALVLGVVIVAFLGLLAYQHVMQAGTAGDTVRVMVPEGATGREVGRILAEEGLIEHEMFFRLALRLDNSPPSIRHGRYDLPRGLSSRELLDLLREGPLNVFDPSEIPDELRVTVPEGLTIAQAAELFDNPELFIEAAEDLELLKRLEFKAPSLEGFLLPNTYFFDRKPSEREVVERMLAQFVREWNAMLEQTPPPEGLTPLEIVTIASLVEEEARAADERPHVAAVIYNRLERKMPLQMDSTIQFALGKYGQRLLYSDREVDSPYNTYKHRGLPPGPISNPGLASLRAALNPSDVDYIYFVSNADGRSHTFSSTHADHVRAVQRFRREIAPQRRALRESEAATE